MLRPATEADADLLLAWRNDPLTVSQSIDARPVAPREHRRWLARVLADPARRLYVAEVGGRPVGTVRADTGEEGAVLSWTVAPEARGKGLGGRMVRLLAGSVDGPAVALVKAGNLASRRIAESAGLRAERESHGIVRYCRD